LLDNPIDISEAFNKYFISNVGRVDNASDSSQFTKFLPKSNPNSFFMPDTFGGEILNIVNNMNNIKSQANDGISNFLVKKTIHNILTPLTHCFNLSLQVGIFPSNLKISKVVPLYNSGSFELLNNYRPISLISSISKILEKLVHTKLSNFFKTLSFQKINIRFQKR